MGETNIFMNSYQQPETKLTYNFLLKRLSQKGFEDDLTNRLTLSKWRLLCKRIPLTESDGFSYSNIKEIFEEILEQLTNESDFKKDLL